MMNRDSTVHEDDILDQDNGTKHHHTIEEHIIQAQKRMGSLNKHTSNTQ